MTSKELSEIIGCLPRAAELCPQLKTGHGFDNVFEQIGRHLFCLDTTEEGLCVFAYQQKGMIRCSLHSVAEQIGVSPYLVKPRACTLWPLALSSTRPAILSVDDDAFLFACNTRIDSQNCHLSPGIAQIIEAVYGRAFRSRVESAANKRMAK